MLLCPTVWCRIDEIFGELTIYPNPTSGIINLSSARECFLSRFEVIDLTGKVVFFGVVNSKFMLDVSHLPKGIYYLKIDRTTSKFVKM